jgi:hypothetical protein
MQNETLSVFKRIIVFWKMSYWIRYHMLYTSIHRVYLKFWNYLLTAALPITESWLLTLKFTSKIYWTSYTGCFNLISEKIFFLYQIRNNKILDWYWIRNIVFIYTVSLIAAMQCMIKKISSKYVHIVWRKWTWIFKDLDIGYWLKVYSNIQQNVGLRSLQSDIRDSVISPSPTSFTHGYQIECRPCKVLIKRFNTRLQLHSENY